MAWFRKYFIDNNQDFPAGIKFLLNVLGILAAFYLTYRVAPNINEVFEQQKKQTTFYQLYFESFNTDTKDFYGKMTVYITSSDTKNASGNELFFAELGYNKTADKSCK